MRPLPERGKPAKQTALINGSDHTIVATYGAVYRGIVQYYLLAGDVYRLHRLRWVMETSMLKTLAGKHRSTVSKMAAKHKAKIETPHGPRTCFEARIERDGRKPLVARFGGIPLHRQKTATVTDRQPIRVDYPHKELITRLLADTCEICQQPGEVQVHHVRKLADLGTTRATPAPMGQGHGQQATQDPRGLRLLPRPHPHRTASHTAHAVVTGEPDDRETIMSGSAGGRAEKDQPTAAPRRAADPSAWLFGYRRLTIRYERKANHFCGFLTLAAALTSYKKLRKLAT